MLSFTIALSLKMVQAVAASFLARYAAAKFLDLGEGMNGINSMALQQGGLGLVLSILIVSAPLIAASFFQGTLAAFSAYSSFGNVEAKDGQVPPGVMRGNNNSPLNKESSLAGDSRQVQSTNNVQRQIHTTTPQPDEIRRD